MLRLTLTACALVCAGCAHGEPPLPVCDGQARRPANPHGSVLTTGPRADLSSAPQASSSPVAEGGCA